MKKNSFYRMFTPLRISNAHGNVAIPLIFLTIIVGISIIIGCIYIFYSWSVQLQELEKIKKETIISNIA